MSLANDRIIYLLQAWTNGTSSPEEENELFDFMARNTDDSLLHTHLQQLSEEDKNQISGIKKEVDWERLYQNIQQKKDAGIENMPGNVIQAKNLWLRYVAAAAILALVFTFGYFRYSRPGQEVINQAVAKEVKPADIEPGADKATLTLGDGRKLVLDSNNKVISDDGLSITNKDGELRYGSTDVITFNTVTTPKGGQYKLTLADGTRVWLNSASSITFPTAFTGNSRKVSITGEAFFEVEKDKSKPFIVNTYRDSIQVFGTSFNVNSYTDEQSIKTTLVEGIVQVDGKILKPGNTYANGKMFAADVDQVIAWKNGNFNFNGLDLQEAMRQLGRWYDLEVEFAGKVPDLELRGEMGRDLKLSQVLNILSKMNLKNQVTDRKLIITE